MHPRSLGCSMPQWKRISRLKALLTNRGNRFQHCCVLLPFSINIGVTWVTHGSSSLCRNKPTAPAWMWQSPPLTIFFLSDKRDRVCLTWTQVYKCFHFQGPCLFSMQCSLTWLPLLEGHHLFGTGNIICKEVVGYLFIQYKCPPDIVKYLEINCWYSIPSLLKEVVDYVFASYAHFFSVLLGYWNKKQRPWVWKTTAEK